MPSAPKPESASHVVVQRVRERQSLSLPVVAEGSIPLIYRRAAFPQPGDPRRLAHIREHDFTPGQKASLRRKECCEKRLNICGWHSTLKRRLFLSERLRVTRPADAERHHTGWKHT